MHIKPMEQLFCELARKHKSGYSVPSCRMKDGRVTELQRRSFKFCCSDKLGICLVFLIRCAPSLVPSKAQDLMFKPPVNPHSDTLKHCCCFLIFHFYAARSDTYSETPFLRSLNLLLNTVSCRWFLSPAITEVLGYYYSASGGSL